MFDKLVSKPLMFRKSILQIFAVAREQLVCILPRYICNSQYTVIIVVLCSMMC